MVHIPLWPRVSLRHQERRHNLELMRKLLAKLGNPHKKLPKTIHIAGTNGKGSSLAFLKSIFTGGGFKVHSYTSPHLLEFNERINLAGNLISDDHLFELLDQVKYAADSLNIETNFFEGTTAAAFLAFSQVPADVLLLETGLGGRLDSTNVIENPIATLITPISMDHLEYLGGTLTAIAIEKAGIIKQGVPCIVSAQVGEVYNILHNKCDEMNSPCFCFEYDYGVNLLPEGFEYLSQKYRLNFPKPSLLGDHQILNAASAIATVMMVNDKFKITSDQIVNGLLCAKWPGRIQKIEKEKYQQLAGDNINIYLDGAHNAGGAEALAKWASTYLKDPVYMILGMTKNRNPIEFCSLFKDIITEGRTVKVNSEPSSYDSSLLGSLASKSGILFKNSNGLEDAIKEFDAISAGREANIIITGSLFLVADFLKVMSTFE